ncbi:hypothetical protein [Mycolicibacterium tusciae]|nr:hypothetical protein [Mycolicibacterium tusciae]
MPSDRDASATAHYAAASRFVAALGAAILALPNYVQVGSHD